MPIGKYETEEEYFARLKKRHARDSRRVSVVEEHQMADGSFAKISKLGDYYTFTRYGGLMDQPEVEVHLSKGEAYDMLESALKEDVLELSL